ncbi:uncharacterized protein LOC124127433 isoform X1 [Haliotis rufescens]|uniref:uncharacterized protein LOC124127433 isoform X1 n=1 Tax=Haliotis rufescens TaxID=6454 RepID=UPI00201E9395|nr:uncharacterized protein LOC124127433 isoform X1 [Haliotis rufescens]
MTTEADLTDHSMLCSICTEVLTDPCTLRCDHSFCRACLTQYLQSKQGGTQSKTIPCPYCHVPYQVTDPTRPVEEWAGQFASSHMTRPADSLTIDCDRKEMICFTCNEIGNSTEGSIWCGMCEVILCSACHKIHSILPVSRDHKVTDVVEGTRNNIKNTIKCSEHSNNAVEYYCKDCTKAVCPVCCILYHRRCESVVTLQSLIPQMRSVLQENSQILSAKMTDIHSKLCTNRNIYTQVQQSITNLQSEIRSYCQRACDLIGEKEDDMMKDLDKRTEKQTETLQIVIKIGKSVETMHKQKVEVLQRALESESVMEIYEVYQACQSGELHATEVDEYAIAEVESGIAVKVKAELENITTVLNESLLLYSDEQCAEGSTHTKKDMDGEDGGSCIGSMEESDGMGTDGKLHTEHQHESYRQGPKSDFGETDFKPSFRVVFSADPHGGLRASFDKGGTDVGKYERCESELCPKTTDDQESVHEVVSPTCTNISTQQESRKRHRSAPQLNDIEDFTAVFYKQKQFAVDVETLGTGYKEPLPAKSKQKYQSAPNLTMIPIMKLQTGTENSLHPETDSTRSSDQLIPSSQNGDPTTTNLEQPLQLELKRELLSVTVPTRTESHGLEEQESDSLKSKFLPPHDNGAKHDIMVEESFTDDMMMAESVAEPKVDIQKGEENEELVAAVPEDTGTDTRQETANLDVENVSRTGEESQRSETERAYTFDSNSLPVYHDTIKTVNNLDVVVLLLDGGFACVVTHASESAVKCIYHTSQKRCENTLRISNLPWTVAKMSNAMVAVTVPRAKQIVLAKVDPELSLHSIIRTHKRYYGLAVMKDSMLVAGCTSDSCIDILAMSGKVIRTISNTSVKCPNFICPTPKQGFIVSDRQTQTVIGFTATGEVDFTYFSKEHAFKENRGIVTTDSGHILVADVEANKVVLLTETGQYVRDVLTYTDDIRKPVGLYLQDAFLYVTQWQNRIKVFKFT